MTVLSWKQLTSIEVGGAICLPVIMVGHQICATYGWQSALLGIAAGNLFLLMMAIITVYMSAKHQASTPENAKKYFGDQGVKLFASLILVAKTCWFAIQLNMMSLSIQEIFQLKSDIIIILLLGSCILMAAWKGLKALSILSSITLPFLVVTMTAAMILAEKRGETAEIELISMGSVSIAIGAAITAVIDMPTYFRHARSIKDGIIAVVILFAVAIPLIEIIGVYLAYQNPSSTVTETLMNPQSFLWNLWIMIFLLLAGWTTNNTNLYSASVCLDSIWKGLSEKLRLTLVAGMGILLASTHLLDHLALFLQMLGIFVGSMGSVILINFISKATPQVKISIAAWGLGVSMGLLNLFHIGSISPIAVIDAFLIAGTSTFLGRCYETYQYRSAG